MNLFQQIPGTFTGMRVIEDIHLTDTVEDWSGCRSVPRAKRRHARGIRTAMRYIQVPKKTGYVMDGGKILVVHPEIARLLREETKKSAEQIASEAFLRKEKPQPDPASPWRSTWLGSGISLSVSPIIATDAS